MSQHYAQKTVYMLKPKQLSQTERVAQHWDQLGEILSIRLGSQLGDWEMHPPKGEILVDEMANLPAHPSKAELSRRMSRFLFRKALPKTVNKLEKAKKLSSLLDRDPLVTEEFFWAAHEVVNRHFRKGWDRDYARNVAQYTLNDSSTLEGFKANSVHLEGILSKEDFLMSCLQGKTLQIPPTRKIKVLEDGRTITIASVRQHQLGPAHKTIYDHLSKFGWIVRGDPATTKFKNFRPAKDEVLVSGDYEESTNHLSSAHSRLLISIMSRNSEHIPTEIWKLAYDSLVGELEYYDNHGELVFSSAQRTGQLMGNFLSFPLLCLTNLITLFITDRKEAARMVKAELVKINGDDIAFRCRPEFFRKWSTFGVPKTGFVMSKEKTLVHPRVFMLNSQAFLCTDGSNLPTRIWAIRSKGLFKVRDGREDQGPACYAIARENSRFLQGESKWDVFRHVLTIQARWASRSSIYSQNAQSKQEFACSPRVWRDKEAATLWEWTYSPAKFKPLVEKECAEFSLPEGLTWIEKRNLNLSTKAEVDEYRDIARRVHQEQYWSDEYRISLRPRNETLRKHPFISSRALTFPWFRLPKLSSERVVVSEVSKYYIRYQRQKENPIEFVKFTPSGSALHGTPFISPPPYWSNILHPEVIRRQNLRNLKLTYNWKVVSCGGCENC